MISQINLSKVKKDQTTKTMLTIDDLCVVRHLNMKFKYLIDVRATILEYESLRSFSDEFTSTE